MSQAWVVAQYDLRRQWRDGALTAVMVVLSVLLAAASFHGVARARAARATVAGLGARVEASEREVRDLAMRADTGGAAGLAWDARNPDFIANDRGTLAVAAPAPLLALSVGLTDLHPTQIKVTAAGRDTATTAVEIAHPLALSTGPFDVEFVLVFLWPLAIVAITFDLVSTDRERGTLRLLLAQPASAVAVVGGPLLGRGAVLLLPAVAVPGLALAAAPSADAPGRLVLWSAAVAAYGVFWIGLAAWVTTRGRAAVANAAWLGGAWLVLTIVMPGIVNLAIGKWGAVPSGVVFADATRAATREALSDGSRVLGHFLEDHPTASAVGRDGLRQYALLQAARDEEVARRLAPVVARYEAALATQRRIAGLARFLSPAMVVSSAMQDAAGTSRDRARSFAVQADAFRGEWRTFFQPRILNGAPLAATDAAALPRFHYREEPWAVVAARAVPGLGALVAAGAGLLWIGIGQAARRPVWSPRP